MEKHIRLALDLEESLIDVLNHRANKEGISLSELINSLLRRSISEENHHSPQQQALPGLIQNLYKTIPKKKNT